MLTVAEALAEVVAHASPLVPERIGLREALGLVLAEDIASDVDSPPHDKSMVDGYAVRTADFSDGRAELRLLEEVVAGAVPTKTVSPGCCTRIMTGAPIPAGADAVVMIERSEPVAEPNIVRLNEPLLRQSQNILPRAASLKRGDIVLRKGRVIGPAEVGVLAEVGQPSPLAIPAPRVAVLSTGNELVPLDQLPGPGQIRNSNGPMLVAAAQRRGAKATELGIARDEPAELREKLAEGLKHDVLLISGGVSAGVLDLVPGELKQLGVEQVFHKVRVKPGKPIWFGVKRSADARGALVFGLPGNPVSSLVCFELFVRPALRILGGHGSAARDTLSARLLSDFFHRGDRPTYYPAVLERDAGQPPAVQPLDWAGSADLSRFSAADALIVFPAGDRQYRSGDTVEVMSLDW